MPTMHICSSARWPLMVVHRKSRLDGLVSLWRVVTTGPRVSDANIKNNKKRCHDMHSISVPRLHHNRHYKSLMDKRFPFPFV